MLSHTGGGERLWKNTRLVAVWGAVAYGMGCPSSMRSGAHTIRLMAGTAGVMPSAPMSRTTEQRPLSPFAINYGKHGKIIGEEHPYFAVDERVKK